MKKLVLLIMCMAFLSGYAQTKLIAFKSHSGSNENFSAALKNNLFDMEDGNFGLPSHPILDSVILVKDSVAIVVKTSHSDYPDVQRDTLKNQPMLRKGTPVDTLRKYIGGMTFYMNPPDSIKFVGFEKEKKTRRNKNSLPLSGNESNYNNPFNGQVVMIAGAIMLLSLLAGLTAWKMKWSPVIQSA